MFFKTSDKIALTNLEARVRALEARDKRIEREIVLYKDGDNSEIKATQYHAGLEPYLSVVELRMAYRDWKILEKLPCWAEVEAYCRNLQK